MLASQSFFRSLIVGADTMIQLPNGSCVMPINFDNAATTPPFVNVMKEISMFAPMYSSIHRSTGYKSEVSTELYETSRLTVMNFVKADPNHDTVIFVKNTTEAINKLSYRICVDKKKHVVLSTEMEHHSNDLPWRNKYHTDYIAIDEAGRLCLDDLVKKLIYYQGAVKLVAVTGASNVTGYVNDIYKIAEIAHSYKAQILVDGAQLVPHAIVDMKPCNSPRHIDYLAFSGHKMYAPFGIGVLIGPTETFAKGAPEYAGGGTVKVVTRSEITWDDPPYKDEAGTPNVMGVVALQAAIKTFYTIDMEKICSYEHILCHYAIQKLRSIPGLILHCDTDLNKPRIGVIPFNLDGIHHALVADILTEEFGIAVRNGCFCAQPYVWKLLKVTAGEAESHIKSSCSCPGMIRVSLGLYNNVNEIDSLIHALSQIVEYKDFYLKKYEVT